MKAYKPLVDQYKSQIASLEQKLATTNMEKEGLAFELNRTSDALRAAEEERDNREAQQQELEMQSLGQELAARKGGQSSSTAVNGSPGLNSPGDLDAHGDTPAEDSFDTNTMTQLRQQVRSLQRQLATTGSAGNSNRELVLQNLLDDANRMKARYEDDYLAEMRAKLKAESQLEEIRKTSSKEDGPATMALRLRLNELVEELDEVKKRTGQDSTKLEKAEEELTVAKSNCERLIVREWLSDTNMRLNVSNYSEPSQSRPACYCEQPASIGVFRNDCAAWAIRSGQEAVRRCRGNTKDAEQSDSKAAARQGRTARRLHQSARKDVSSRERLHSAEEKHWFIPGGIEGSERYGSSVESRT